MSTATSPVRRIVVGIDGSETSKRALRWAVHLLSDAPHPQVDAVAVCDLPMALGADLHYLLPGWDPVHDTRRMLTRTVTDVLGPDIPPFVRQRVVEGQAAAELIAASDGAELLVVGSRGRSTFTKLVLGSVGSQCVHHARCPVLVVHETEPPEFAQQCAEAAAVGAAAR